MHKLRVSQNQIRRIEIFSVNKLWLHCCYNKKGIALAQNLYCYPISFESLQLLLVIDRLRFGLIILSRHYKNEIKSLHE